MLIVATCMHQLRFGQLMEVYAESNRENGEDFFPDCTPQDQIIRAEQEYYTYLADCFFQEKDAAYYIWSVDGQYVSALRLEPYQDGMLLEALETHPEHRGRGYATALVQAVLQQTMYPKIYVHISRKNAPSIAVHTSCGFRKILSFARYADGSVLYSSDTYLYEKTTL